MIHRLAPRATPLAACKSAQQHQGNTANFHYTDNLNRSIRHCGRCIVDMIPHYYDAKRIIRMMKDDGSIEATEVNVPVQRSTPMSKLSRRC